MLDPMCMSLDRLRKQGQCRPDKDVQKRRSGQGVSCRSSSGYPLWALQAKMDYLGTWAWYPRANSFRHASLTERLEHSEKVSRKRRFVSKFLGVFLFCSEGRNPGKARHALLETPFPNTPKQVLTKRRFSQKTADFRRFTPSSGNSGIWLAQETAENRRFSQKPKIFKEDRRKPQIQSDWGPS